MRAFVDTNVLLDFLLRREPHFGPAARLFDKMESGAVEAFVSAISFNNIFYLARKPLGGDGARELLRDLRRVCRTVALDEDILDAAIELTISDYEDAIQAVSAGRIQSPFIVTRNARDFEGSGINAYAAEEFLALLDEAAAQ
jgi:predicted nucleic acid-binding protein